MGLRAFKVFKKTTGFTPLEARRRRRPTVAFGNSLAGFTLIEVMVVVIIIGILVSLAIPNYVNTREKAMDKEAISGLKIIRAANRQYYVQNESYFPPSGTAIMWQIDGNLSIVLSGTTWVWNLTHLAGGGFNATATRNGRIWWVTNDTAEPICTGTCL